MIQRYTYQTVSELPNINEDRTNATITDRNYLNYLVPFFLNFLIISYFFFLPASIFVFFLLFFSLFFVFSKLMGGIFRALIK